MSLRPPSPYSAPRPSNSNVKMNPGVRASYAAALLSPAGSGLLETASTHSDSWDQVLSPPASGSTATMPSTASTSYASLDQEETTSSVWNLKSAPYYRELQNACNAVRLASRLCQAVQQQLAESDQVSKHDESPVTVADYGAQALVAWCLSRSDPLTKLSMIAEESSASLREPSAQPMLQRITQVVNAALATEFPDVELLPHDVLELIDHNNSQGGPTGRHWVLDPVDGTRGFVGLRQYAVCLGLIEEGQVVLGVLGCPNLPYTSGGAEEEEDGASSSGNGPWGQGSLFFAHQGFGAYCSPLWQYDGQEALPPRRVWVHDVQPPFQGARFMEAVEAKHSDHSFTAALAQRVGVTLPPLRMDSQVKYGVLSRGGASTFMRFPSPDYKEKIWDHAAGFVIVEEAGGKVTDGTGKRLDFSHGHVLEGLSHGIVAAPPTIHAAIIDAVQALKKLSSSGSTGSHPAHH